jgi:4-hydroxybenzoate polyprenyltransferase and related prenyltransferases
MKSLVVDLDNSLIKIDLFVEKLLKSIFINPFKFLTAIKLLFKNKAAAKDYIAKNFPINPQVLPYNKNVLKIIERYKKNNYKIILSTGASSLNAHSIANHLALFDETISSDGKTNNIGYSKLDKIKSLVGNEFVYLGDSNADIPIWTFCKQAIIVNPNRSTTNRLKNKKVKILEIFKNQNYFSKIKLIIKQLRVHQWAKNSLIFIPAISSFQEIGLSYVHGFLSFSFLASSIYIINDIIDLDRDRIHPKKTIVL